ncbi:hypothetical protein Ae201684P_002728 [Aphanomyces euteiches]|nr:hypothetical protein Ae201684P_002728 [Aphanomyces euteiches]
MSLVQPPSTPHDYILRFDVSCLGNGLTSSDPPCGAGAALFAPDGTVIWSLSSYLPPPTNSNNTAEYKALLAGLIGALHWRPRRLVIEGDSRLVIDQVLGRARCKTLVLRPLRNNALALLRRLRSHDIDYSFRHIERNFNSVADGLAKDGATDRATTCECACPSPGTTCVPSAHLSPTPQLRSMDMIWCMENEQLIDRTLYVHRCQPASYDMDVTEPSPPSIMDSTAGTRDPQTAHVVVMDTYATPHAMSLDNSSTPLTAAPQPLEEYTQTRPIFDTSDMDTTSPLDQDVAASAEPPTDAVGQPAAQDSTATPSPNPHTAFSDDMDVSVPEPAHTSHSPQRTQRARRLHLPSNIAQHKLEAAQASLRRMVEQWTAAIDDDDTWTSTGRTLDELPSILTQLVHSLSSGENPTASAPSTSAPLTSNQPSPCEPRTHTHRRSNSGPRRQSRLSQRIDNAIHDLHTTEKSANRNRIQHARRRVSRLKRAQSRLDLRELFNRSPAKCVDQILRPVLGELVVSRCEIPLTQLEAHFTAVHRPSLLSTMPPATAMSHSLSDAITTDEIETALDTCRLASAPGLDGIPYRILYKFRLTLLPYLTAAFNSCWTHKRIPQGWKQSVTELIHKKGDPMDPSNWRPLALQSTLYKLYITVAKSRFSTWLECNNRFNNAQKGFRAFNGCHEHNFLSQSVMDTTRRKAKPLFVVWYDLRNAFGSIVVPVVCLFKARCS